MGTSPIQEAYQLSEQDSDRLQEKSCGFAQAVAATKKRKK